MSDPTPNAVAPVDLTEADVQEGRRRNDLLQMIEDVLVVASVSAGPDSLFGLFWWSSS
jgi:hypothetical protein